MSKSQKQNNEDIQVSMDSMIQVTICAQFAETHVIVENGMWGIVRVE